MIRYIFQLELELSNGLHHYTCEAVRAWPWNKKKRLIDWTQREKQEVTQHLNDKKVGIVTINIL